MKCLLIGLGNAGFEYDNNFKNKTLQSHLNTILIHKKISEIYLLDKNKKSYEKIKNFIKKTTKKIIYLNKLPSKKFFDLIIIATPTSSHYNLLKNIIIKKMTKNIICEKPFTNIYKNSKEIYSLALKNNIKILINYHRRYLPFFKKIKDLIFKKKIKKINIFYSKGIFQNGCHFINLIIYIFGIPNRNLVLKVFDKVKGFTRVNFIMIYNTFNVNFNAISLSNTKDNTLIIYFDNQKLIIKNNEVNFYRKKKNLYRLRKKNNKLQNMLMENLKNYQQYVINNFFFKKNYNKNLNEALLTDEILNIVSNEKIKK